MTPTLHESLIENVRERKPLIHQITNYVTANDCANITLGIGASPIMADSLREAAEIAAISSALVLNMGTLNERTAPSMFAAGKAANQAGVPVVFDPVGAGSSTFRNETAAQLIEEVNISVLRGNISEISFLAGLASETKGVDASVQDLGKNNALQVARNAAATHSCIVAVTGQTDTVSDIHRTVQVNNGHPLLTNLTGTGCMCTSLIGSLCGANPQALFNATVTAVAAMGIAGEIAADAAKGRGNGSFHGALHDAVSQLDTGMISVKAQIYETRD